VSPEYEHSLLADAAEIAGGGVTISAAGHRLAGRKRRGEIVRQDVFQRRAVIAQVGVVPGNRPDAAPRLRRQPNGPSLELHPQRRERRTKWPEEATARLTAGRSAALSWHEKSRQPEGAVHRLVVESEVLKANMLGDPTDRRVDVYTPAGSDGAGLPLLVDLVGFTAGGPAHTNWQGFREKRARAAGPVDRRGC